VKAAVVRSFDEPLAVEDVPVPEPGPEQVLVHIEASGLCHPWAAGGASRALDAAATA
jgi:D-arabinose 1-dehydrogenase-like Zn-dependent alcohol dehydrogenase